MFELSELKGVLSQIEDLYGDVLIKDVNITEDLHTMECSVRFIENKTGTLKGISVYKLKYNYNNILTKPY